MGAILSRRTLNLGIIALTLALAYGIWYAYSVILVALLHEFGWSRSVLAGAFSVFTLVQVRRDFQDRLGLALGIVSSSVG